MINRHERTFYNRAITIDPQDAQAWTSDSVKWRNLTCRDSNLFCRILSRFLASSLL